MRRFWAALFLFLTVLSGIGVWYFFASIPLKELPRDGFLPEGAKLENGTLNWFEVLKSQYPEGWQTDRNAFRRLAKTVLLHERGRYRPALSDEEREEILKRQEEMMKLLALEPEEWKNAGFLSDPLSAYKEMLFEKYADDDAEREKRDAEDAMEIPGKDPVFAAEWVRENSPLLDEIARIVQDSEMFFIPMVGDGRYCAMNQLLPYSAFARSLANGLIFRAAYRIAQGELDGAIADAAVCRHLSQLYQKDAIFLVEFLIGFNIGQIAKYLPFYENADAPLSEDQLMKLEESAQKYPMIAQENVYSRIARNERMVCLDMFLPSPYPKDPGFEPTNHPIFHLGVDWNAAVEEMLRIHTRRQTDPKLDLEAEQKEQLQKLYESFPLSFLLKKAGEAINELEGGSLFPWCLLPRKDRSILIGMAMDVICTQGHIQLVFQRACDRASLERILFARERYRLANGGKCLPRTLSDADGKPLHSWRVLLLPYLGEAEKELFAKIRLDEPWDSPHNAQFHAVNVEAFEREVSPNGGKIAKWNPGETFFAIGKDPDSELPLYFRSLEEPICWMAPDPEPEPEEGSTP